MIDTHVRLPDQLHDALRQAQKQRESFNATIIRVIEKGLKK